MTSQKLPTEVAIWKSLQVHLINVILKLVHIQGGYIPNDIAKVISNVSHGPALKRAEDFFQHFTGGYIFLPCARQAVTFVNIPTLHHLVFSALVTSLSVQLFYALFNKSIAVVLALKHVEFTSLAFTHTNPELPVAHEGEVRIALLAILVHLLDRRDQLAFR